MATRGTEWTASLRRAGFRGDLLPDEPLAPWTTWRIGGPADVLASPRDAADVTLAVAWAADRGIPWRVLGNGSNLLVLDDGVPGIVVRLRKTLEAIACDGPRMRAEAGASLPAAANRAAELGLSGIEFGGGIPGTIGGAIVMNAGWHEFEIGRVVESVVVLSPSGSTAAVPGSDCGFGYRTSRFREERRVVLSADLVLTPDEPETVRARLDHYAASRKANQPTELPSCGSVFLKPSGDFAGRLIEAAGLKGLRVGGVRVSPKHANFFVNEGEATAEDVLALVERVEAEVERRFGVKLAREFEIWGGRSG